MLFGNVSSYCSVMGELNVLINYRVKFRPLKITNKIMNIESFFPFLVSVKATICSHKSKVQILGFSIFAIICVSETIGRFTYVFIATIDLREHASVEA